MDRRDLELFVQIQIGKLPTHEMAKKRNLKIWSEDNQGLVKDKISEIFGKQPSLAQNTSLSLRTISNFANGKPINPENFVILSEALKLDWEKLSTSTQSSELENLKFFNLHYFSGRNDELEELHRRLTSSKDGIGYDAIIGMWGCGKSELASVYASYHFYEKPFYVGGVVWIDARFLHPGEQIEQFVKDKFNYQSKKKEIKERLKDCYNNWGAEDNLVLLIFDDVNKWNDIKESLPPWRLKRFKVLITSRIVDLHTSVIPFDLKVLDLDQAIELISKIIGLPEINIKDRANLERICKKIGCLPLAIEIIGNYLKKYRLKLNAAIREVNKNLKKNGLVSNEFKFSEDTRTEDDFKRIAAQHVEVERTIYSSLSLTWNDNKFTHPVKELSYFMSCFANTWINIDVIVNFIARSLSIEEEKAMQMLDEVMVFNSFIQVSNYGEYKYHELVRDYVKVKLSRSPLSEGILIAFVLNVVTQVDDSINLIPDIKTSLLIKKIIPHIEYLYTDNQFDKLNVALSSVDRENIYTPYRQSALARDISTFYAGLFLNKEAFKWEQIADSIDTSEATEYQKIYSLNSKLMLLKEPEDREEQIDEINNILGETHLEETTYEANRAFYYYLNLAAFYFHSHNHEGMKGCLDKINSIVKELQNKGDWGHWTRASYHRIWGMYFSLVDDYDKAVSEYNRSLYSYKKQRHKVETNLWENSRHEDTKTRREIFKSTVFVEVANENLASVNREKTLWMQLNKNRQEQIYTLSLLGFIHCSCGKYEKGYIEFNNAYEKALELYGQGHPKISEYLCYLGETELDRENKDEALVLFKDALKLRINDEFEHEENQNDAVVRRISEGVSEILEDRELADSSQTVDILSEVEPYMSQILQRFADLPDEN